MNPDKNPYPTAKLKRLPDPIKDELLARTLSPGVTQAQALAWLAEAHGVESSPAALSEFCSWWPARKRALAREQAVQVWMESEKELHPELTDADLFRRGQRKFALMAIADDDPDAWARTQGVAADATRLEIKRQELLLAERRVAVLESKLKAVGDEIRRAKESGGLTPETLAKIEEAAKIL